MPHSIAVIPGDGIGPEVVGATRTVLDAVADVHGLDLQYEEFDWSCRRYAETGAMMPDDALDRLAEHDAILLGAVGWPGVPDHVSLWGLLIPIRRHFRQYVNQRPIAVFEGVESPLRGARPGEVDLVVVRENVEGEYSEIGGRLNRGFPDEMAVQEAVFTRVGVSRIADYAFELARQRSGYLTSATKSNGIVHTMPFWDEVVAERAAEYPDVRWDSELIDALAAKVVLEPERFDVIVASNLFGDILSDLTAAVAGSIGIAPSANLDPTREHPVDVRAGARLGAGHRRQGRRQPGRHALVGGDDARPPRPRGGGGAADGDDPVVAEVAGEPHPRPGWQRDDRGGHRRGGRGRPRLRPGGQASSVSSGRTACRAAWMRDFTVPRGRSSRRAISL